MTSRKSSVPCDAPSPPRRAIISRLHQQAAGIVTVICLLTMGAHWAIQDWRRNRLIDIDLATEQVEVVVQSQININDAEWPELTLLPGISETLARRMVKFRQQHGRFGSLDELEMVTGIGPRSLARMRPHLVPLAGGPTEVGPALDGAAVQSN